MSPVKPPVNYLEPATLTRMYRGAKFVFEEVPVGEYDECVEQATSKVFNAITGGDEDRVDENLVLRLLIRKSLKQPKISDSQVLGTRLMRQLERDVREVHFGLEPDAAKKDDKKDDEDDESPNVVAG
jgi:hypothetical protein